MTQLMKSRSEHLYLELYRINLLLERSRIRSGQTDTGIEYNQIGSNNLNRIQSTQSYEWIAWNEPEESLSKELVDIDERLSVPESSPFAHLIQEFELSVVERNVLISAVAPHVSPRFAEAYSAIEPGPHGPQPTVDLLVHLFGESTEDYLAIRKACSNRASLFRYRFMNFGIDPYSSRTYAQNQMIDIDGRILNYLLGDDQIEASPYFSEFQKTTTEPELDDQVRAKRVNLAKHISQKTGLRIVHIQSECDAENEHTADQICASSAYRVLKVNLKRAIADGADLRDVIFFAFREARLLQLAIVIPTAQLLWDANGSLNSSGDYLMQEADFYAGILILCTSAKTSLLKQTPKHCELIDFHISSLTTQSALNIWQEEIPNLRSTVENFDELVGGFNFSRFQIQKAASYATARAVIENGVGATPNSSDILAGCHAIQERDRRPEEVKPEHQFTWEDLILPESSMVQLRDACIRVRRENQVFTEWGFRKTMPSGSGLAILFSGASGTGKTMAAGILASELGRELYKIDPELFRY